MNPTYYANLAPTDTIKQVKMIEKSRKDYKRKVYATRKTLSYPVKVSRHILKAQKLYGLKIIPSKELALKTGCSLKALKKIVKKGEGAYYSSGSRPNQTPFSWAHARLASAVTGGKASFVDRSIIETCDRTKPAYKLHMRSK